MLPADPDPLRRFRHVCLVAGPGEVLTPRVEHWHQRGCQTHTFDGVARASGGPYAVAEVHGGPGDPSDRVRLTLTELHRQHHFDLIEFPAAGGLGFRAVQAKRSGLAFADTTLAVRLDDCSSWRRECERRWPDGPDDLQIDYLERYAFENACVQLTPVPEVLAHIHRVGWAFHEGAPPATVEQGQSARPLVSICVPHHNLGRYLPATLASLAAQTYPHVEVTVIDDGSTDPTSLAVFEQMQQRHPGFRFVRQANAGIGATRNRGLFEAHGELFLPVDADNILRPDMLERFVAGMRHRPELAALTCYFLAFRDEADLAAERFAYACRPTGGPHVLGCLQNVYGDACAIYRTEAFRAVGGYETDRGTSFEDWEAFVKLVNAGHCVDVLPEHLFYYRHRPTGFSRVTNAHANHERVLRQYRRLERLPPADREVLWGALAGFHRRLQHLEARRRSLPARLAGRLRHWLKG